MRRLFCNLVPVVGMLLLAPLMLQAEPVEQINHGRLQQTLATLAESDGFFCRFTQIVYFAGGGDQLYSGTLFIRRPGHFRWQYMIPYQQLYVSAGDVVWHYEPDLMQAERITELDAIDPVAMKLLDGRIGVKDIEVLGSEPVDNDIIAYRIRLAGGSELSFAVDANNQPVWIESEDMLGNRNRVILSDIDMQDIPDSEFEFAVPEGVDVVDISAAEADNGHLE
ncbi:MAG: outer membrane lipoprotein carrier protein LolA [Mariprofundus sp.]